MVQGLRKTSYAEAVLFLNSVGYVLVYWTWGVVFLTVYCECWLVSECSFLCV